MACCTRNRPRNGCAALLTSGSSAGSIKRHMRFGRGASAIVGVGLLWVAAASLRLDAQRGGIFHGSADDPGIAYSSAPLDNAIERLNRRLQDGSATLTFQGRSGYLQSAIDALQLPIDSQLLVFSRQSLQGRLIEPSSPRALFFNDRVTLAWVRDGDLLEDAAHDENGGVIFYSLEDRKSTRLN